VWIAEQAGLLCGPIPRLLIVTAAWTGCRWGELAGLRRDNVDLRRGVIVIDPLVGALHESGSMRWLGPPKTRASARVIALPPFLVALLREHLVQHRYEFVFTTPSGTWL
jgi:integrase